MDGKCKVRGFILINLKASNVKLDMCINENTKFDFTIDGEKVKLSRKAMNLEILKKEFEKDFLIIE